MQAFNIFLKVFELIVLVYFGFAALYIFIFSFAGLFKIKKTNSASSLKRKFAVLIPGYKEDNVIVDVAKKALEQQYDSTLFDVVVIADSFQQGTLEQLRSLPVQLVEVSFEKSTKSKALNKAMDIIGDDYDVALILDADNVMAPDFIPKVNEAFNQGFRVVQGHRVAKNTNTAMAILDAISEEVNNHIFRKGHRVLGLSSALIGSGMAFDYRFFKSTMATINAVGGFDKELELTLLRDRTTISYIEDAIVLDEKVQKTEVFANQRKRWLSAQFIYFKRFAWSGLKALLLEGNLDFADKVYQMVSPPRILLLGIVALITAFYAAVDIWLGSWPMAVPANYWYLTLVLTVLAFLMAVPKAFYNRETLRALLTLPKTFAIMFLSLFKLKGANKKFIHTQHGTINP